MLEISPLEFRFPLEEKTTFKKSFSLKNSGSEPLTIKLYARPAPGLDNAAYGRLAEWLSFSEPTITLAAGEVKTVPFSITVPESSPPGGQYAFLYAEILSTPASAAPSGNAFSLTSRAAIRLYGISEASAVRSVSVSSPHATTFSFSPTQKNPFSPFGKKRPLSEFIACLIRSRLSIPKSLSTASSLSHRQFSHFS